MQGDALANGNSRKSVMGVEKCQALKSSALRKRLMQLVVMSSFDAWAVCCRKEISWTQKRQ